MKKLTIIIIILAFTSFAFAQSVNIKDSDNHTLIQINDEGDNGGSITLPDATSVSPTTNKLYNIGSSLYWNGSALGLAGSAGGWTDGGPNVYLTTSTDKVGIGDDSPTYKLDVAGKIGINDTQVLYLPDQTNFTGTLILGDGGGSLSHSSGEEGHTNTAVGIGALNANTTGHGNTASGAWALQSNTTGYQNTASGREALHHNTTGLNNTASGYVALYSNTTGSYNTASGGGALSSNTEGNYNTGIGYSADNNNQAGSSNTIIGYEAGKGTSLHNKSGNVFIGYQAGYNETGSNKLYIENSNASTPLIGGDFSTDDVTINGNLEVTGAFKDKDGEPGSAGQILSSTVTGTDWIASPSADNLGNHTATDDLDMASYAVNLNGGWLSGDGDDEGVYVDSDGDVGIGTTTPGAKLEIIADCPWGANDISGLKIKSDEGTTNDYIYINTSSDHYATIRAYERNVGPNNLLIQPSGGNVGIGTTDPQRTLHVNDVMRLEPRSSAPSSPSEGDIYMDSSVHKLMVYDGTIWKACWE